MKKLTVGAFIVCLTLGSAEAIEKEIGIIDGQPATTCKYLDQVEGVFSSLLPSDQLKGAKKEAAQEASRLGGTHIKILSEKNNLLNGVVIAEAYKCSGKFSSKLSEMEADGKEAINAIRKIRQDLEKKRDKAAVDSET